MDREQAANAIAKAIHDHAEAIGMDTQQMLLADWYAVCAWVGPDGYQRYTTHWSVTSAPHNRAGLLYMAQTMLDESLMDE